MIAPATSGFGIQSGKKDWKFVVSKNFVLDPTLSTGAKMLYIALTSFLNEDGTCFPSRLKLMKCLRMGKDTFYKYIAELEAVGYARRQQSVGCANRFGNTIYTIFEYPQPSGNSTTPASELPCPDFPHTEIPCPVPPHTETKDTNSTHTETVPKEKNNQEEEYPASQGVTSCHQGKHDGKGTSKFIQFRDQWILEFKTLFGVDYEFQGKGDGVAASKLVSNGRTVEDLIVLAKTGWASKDRWVQSQCRKSISAFAACINQIATEGKAKAEVLDPYAKISF